MKDKADQFNRVVSATPQNQTAARVMSKGVHYEPTMAPAPHHVSTDVPLPMRDIRSTAPETQVLARALVGKIFGRLTVKGLAVGKSRWVVRCSCGQWEHRRAKALQQGEVARLMCRRCDKVKEYARMYREEGGKSVEDFFAKQLSKGGGNG